MTDLERWLAAQARDLGLGTDTVGEADAEVLRDYCRQVLSELAARGLLAAEEVPGCYAVVRPAGN